MNQKSGNTHRKLLARQALDQEMKNSIAIPNEWRYFTKKEQNILLGLEDANISLGALIDQVDLILHIDEGSPTFVEQCIRCCLASDDNTSFGTKFLDLFHLIEDAIENKTAINISKIANLF